jgi:hypothetical protein
VLSWAEPGALFGFAKPSFNEFFECCQSSVSVFPLSVNGDFCPSCGSEVHHIQHAFRGKLTEGSDANAGPRGLCCPLPGYSWLFRAFGAKRAVDRSIGASWEEVSDQEAASRWVTFSVLARYSSRTHCGISGSRRSRNSLRTTASFLVPSSNWIWRSSRSSSSANPARGQRSKMAPANHLGDERVRLPAPPKDDQPMESKRAKLNALASRSLLGSSINLHVPSCSLCSRRHPLLAPLHRLCLSLYWED